MSVKRYMSSDEGFALGTVMGAIALITVIAIGGFVVAQETLGESMRVTEENRAYQAASSAMDAELSVFKPENLVTGVSPSGYAYDTSQTINGADWFIVSVNDSGEDPSLGPDEYEMIATGGSGTATETVSVRFQSFNLWDMNISGAENSNVGSGAGFNGNGTIIGKVYSNGDFNWTGNGKLEAGPIFVRNGTFYKDSSGSNVGYDSEPVAAYFDNPPEGHIESNYYAEQKGSAPKIEIPWPTQADMDNWRKWAENDSDANLLGTTGADGVRHPNAVSNSRYNVFNGDVTIGGFDFGRPGRVTRTTFGTVDEFNSGDVIAVSGSTLYINGVVYIDGTVTIDSSIRQYIGKGMIVARQGVVINGRLVPASFNSGDWEMHDGTPMPLTSTNDNLGFATLGDVTQRTADWVCGMVFASGKYVAEPTGAAFRGSMIANGIDFRQPNCWLVTQPGMSANKPEGLPALNNMNARSDWIRR